MSTHDFSGGCCSICGIAEGRATSLGIVAVKCGVCPGTATLTLEPLLDILRENDWKLYVHDDFCWQETLCGPREGAIYRSHPDRDTMLAMTLSAAEGTITYIGGATGIWIPGRGRPVEWHKEGIAPNGFSSSSTPCQGPTKIIFPSNPDEGALKILNIEGLYFKLPAS